MASILKVDKLDPQNGTELEIGTSGDTITVPSGASLTLTDSTLSLPTTINTDKIDPKSGTALEIGSSGDTITIPSGATFTQSGTMNASAITAGTIATARLGSGTASSSTVLYGDQTYKAEPTGGKILQVQSALLTGQKIVSSTSYEACNIVDSITCSATSSTVLVIVAMANAYHSTSIGGGITLTRHTAVVADGGAIAGTKIYEVNPFVAYEGSADISAGASSFVILDSPSSTSEQFYQIFIKNRTASGSFYVGMGDDLNHSVTLLEVGA